MQQVYGVIKSRARRSARIYCDVVDGQQHISLKGETTMLETIAVILVILWLLGLVSSYTMGGFIHVLLVIALVVVVLRVIRGRGAL